MHAAALWPNTQMEVSQWNKVADEHGFIVVYPSGTDLSGGTNVLPFRVWLLRPEAVLSATVRFISELIDTLEAAYFRAHRLPRAERLSCGSESRLARPWSSTASTKGRPTIPSWVALTAARIPTHCPDPGHDRGSVPPLEAGVRRPAVHSERRY